MVHVKRDSDQKARSENQYSEIINGNFTFTTRVSIRNSKIFQTLRSQVGGGSTVSSRTFTWTNQTSSPYLHSFNFAGMHTSSVVSTRSWSGPSVNRFSTHKNTHGVLGFNTFHSVPTHGDLIERVSNPDSFVKELNLGPVENQIDQIRRKNTPAAHDKNSVQIRSSNCLKTQDENKNVRDGGSKNAATRTKNIKVSHVTILSQKVGC